MPNKRFQIGLSVALAGLAPMAPALASDTLVLLYNHGSSGRDGARDCRPVIGIPPWARRLNGRRITVMMDGQPRRLRIRVRLFCSDAAHEQFAGGNCGGKLSTKPGDRQREEERRKRCLARAACSGMPRVCNRAFLIANEVDRLAAAGIDRRLIFVGGQSAGGWAAMLIKAWDRNRFNGVIATSPNFFGSRHHRFCKSRDCRDWEDSLIRARQWMHARHERFIATARHSKAGGPAVMLFAMHCDAHNYPWEFPYLLDHVGGTSEIQGRVFGAARVFLFPEWVKLDVKISRGGGSDEHICDSKKGTAAFHNGVRRQLCGKIVDRGRAKEIQKCSVKRLAYCGRREGSNASPEDCKKHAHAGYYRTRRFTEFSVPRIVTWMRGRVRGWQGGGTKAHGYPCDFLKMEMRTDGQGRCDWSIQPPPPGRWPPRAH